MKTTPTVASNGYVLVFVVQSISSILTLTIKPLKYFKVKGYCNLARILQR